VTAPLTDAGGHWKARPGAPVGFRAWRGPCDARADLAAANRGEVAGSAPCLAASRAVADRVSRPACNGHAIAETSTGQGRNEHTQGSNDVERS